MIALLTLAAWVVVIVGAAWGVALVVVIRRESRAQRARRPWDDADATQETHDAG